MQPRSTNGIKTTTSNKIRAVNTRRPKYHHALSSKEAIILRLRRRLQSVNSKTNSQFQSKHKSFYTDAMMWITITENWKQPGCEFLASKARFIRHQARVCNFCRRRHWIIIPTSYNHFTLISSYPNTLIYSHILILTTRPPSSLLNPSSSLCQATSQRSGNNRLPGDIFLVDTTIDIVGIVVTIKDWMNCN